MEGFTNKEVAGRLGCRLRTVERELQTSNWKRGHAPRSHAKRGNQRVFCSHSTRVYLVSTDDSQTVVRM